MSKMDALNQQFVCRVCQVLNGCNAGLYDEHETLKVINNIREDYLECMINVLEEDIINDNK